MAFDYEGPTSTKAQSAATQTGKNAEYLPETELESTTTSPHSLPSWQPINILATHTAFVPKGLPSPACSVSTQTTEGFWTDASPIKDEPVAQPMEASARSVVPTEYASEESLEALSALVVALVADGDLYWEQSHPKRCTSLSAKINTEKTIRFTLLALRDAGVLSEAVAAAIALYLNRLSAISAKHVSRFTVKRLLAASCIVANKICSDTYYAVSYYSHVTGLTAETITEYEWTLLTHLDFNVQFGIKNGDVFVEDPRLLLGVAYDPKYLCS